MVGSSSVVTFGVYQAMREMADIVFELADRGSLEDLRSQSVDPGFYQTTAGLYLECNNGLPVAFWTPLGRWQFCRATRLLSSVQAESLLRDFMAYLFCTIYLPEDSERKTVVGPVYSIKVFEKLHLPEAQLRFKRDLLAPRVALEQWAKRS